MGVHYIRSSIIKCSRQHWFQVVYPSSSSGKANLESAPASHRLFLRPAWPKIVHYICEEVQMQEMTHFKLRDWLVPPIVVPAFLLILVVIVSLYR